MKKGKLLLMGWAVLLLAFFITSSALSRLFRKQKQGLDEKFSKGHERDAGQVFGNGGVATLFAALHWFQPDAAWPWLAFAAALAAVNADTWATELGVLNPAAPRLITHLRQQVEKGTSGGVSLGGTMAALLGSALIATLVVLVSPIPGSGVGAWLLVTLAGLAGCAARLSARLARTSVVNIDFIVMSSDGGGLPMRRYGILVSRQARRGRPQRLY